MHETFCTVASNMDFGYQMFTDFLGSVNPSNAEATFVQSTRMQILLKSCHVGIHWITLTEHSQMSTHLPGFQSFFSFFASFCIGKISHHQHNG